MTSPTATGADAPVCDTGEPWALLGALSDAVIVVDSADRVRYAAPATERILGEAPGTLLGQPLGITIVEDETTEVGISRQDGSHCIIEMRVTPITWDDRPARLLCLRDVTARCETEEAVRRAIARDAGRDACERIARDFRDLLTTVLCGAQLVEEAARKGQDVVDLTQQVVAAARETSQLTKRLLSVVGARVRGGHRAGLDETVRAFEGRMRPLLGDGLAFEVELGAPEASVALDPALLDDVLSELVQNACDALPRDGQLRVRTDTRDVRGAFRSVAPGPYAVLIVEDTGTGMTPETRERLFDAYYTTKARRRGRGLGLAEVYGLVEQSGGFIEVESEVGEGTRIEVLLPLASTESADTPQRLAAHGATSVGPGLQRKAAGPHGALVGRTILLAEDEEGIRRLLGEVLEQAGAQVVSAADAVEAESVLADPEQHIDLLITDMRMPGGNGLNLVRRARSEGDLLPAIVISGFSAHMPLGALPKGPTEFLAKPFLPGDLLDLACGLIRTAETAG